jgi:ATP-binding cassette subfamily F protein uup
MTLSALEEGLVHFPGCALIVSHDRWFLDRVATGILAFEGEGRVTFYEGNYSEYLERRALGGGGSSSPATAPATVAKAPAPLASPAPAAAAPAKPAKLTYAEKQEFAGLEARIEAAEARATTLEAELNDPGIYRTRGAAVPALTVALAEARAEVERLYARWAELGERA